MKQVSLRFEPKEKYREDENGNMVKLDPYKGTEFEEIVEFLKEKGTKEDRAEFKKNCYLAAKKSPTDRQDKNGKRIMEIVKDDNGNPVMVKTDKLNWLYAKKKFFEKYAPEYIATKKKANKASLIADW